MAYIIAYIFTYIFAYITTLGKIISYWEEEGGVCTKYYKAL